MRNRKGLFKRKKESYNYNFSVGRENVQSSLGPASVLQAAEFKGELKRNSFKQGSTILPLQFGEKG